MNEDLEVIFFYFVLDFVLLILPCICAFGHLK